MHPLPSRILLLAICLASRALAQPQPQLLPRPDDAPVRFDHLSNEDGLSQHTVYAILQDRRGFMWFTTQTGLNRFDGYQFKDFYPDPADAKSLGFPGGKNLMEDRTGMIWIGHWTGGLDRFDPVTETFTHFRHDENEPGSLSANWVGTVVEDRAGTLWVGSWGLNRYNPATESFTTVLPDPRFQVYQEDEAPENGGNWVNAIHEDPQGMLWLGTAGGLFRYDPVRDTFTRYRHDAGDPASLSDDRVAALYEDREGTLWVGSWGLNRYDSAADAFTRFYMVPTEPDAGPGGYGTSRVRGANRVTSMLEDGTGTFWVSTGMLAGGSGLYQFGRRSRLFQSVSTHADSDVPDVYALYEDRQGILWVGTGEGVSRTDRTTRLFTQYRPAAGAQGGLQGQLTIGLFLDGDDALWVGSWDGVLNRLDRRTGAVTAYEHDPTNSRTIGRSQVRAIHRDRRGRLWVGTLGDRGLQRLDETTGRFTSFRHDPADPHSIGGNRISTIFEDGTGILWIGTIGAGLNRFEPESGTFTRYQYDPVDSLSITGDDISTVFEDPVGRLWAAGHSGVSRLDPENGRFTRYDLSEVFPIGQSIFGPSLYVRPVEPDVLWVATMEGLVRLEIETGRATLFTMRNSGLPDNSAYCVLGDEAGRLWIATNHGVVRFDPDAGTWSVYGLNDGMAGLEHDHFACHRSSTGELFFGGSKGVTAIRPDDRLDNPYPPEVVLTEMRVAGASIRLPASGALTLPHDDNDLELHFVGVHYKHPTGNRYRYMLEGYDQTWSEVTQVRQANYTNLPPGDYTFRVRAMSSDGIWNEEGASIRITILPPWWRTWWAYGFYLIFAMGSAVQGYRWQHARVVARERVAARERELAQAREIERQHVELTRAHETLKSTQAQLVQSEKLASLGQLTAGIAHEIQNPLNFVNNFAELNEEVADELKETIRKNRGGSLEAHADEIDDLAGSVKTNAGQIAKHGKRAEAIVKSMMAHATAGSGERLLVEVNDFVAEYVRLASGAFATRRPDIDVKIEEDYDPATGTIRMAPQELGRALVNVLSNAFDAVRKRAESGEEAYVPTVSVSTRRGDDGVEIRVADNGVGVPHSVRDKVFEPFFTTKPTGEGTGLGLSLAHDIVVQGHGGKLEVKSGEGNGVTFVIALPAHGRQ